MSRIAPLFALIVAVLIATQPSERLGRALYEAGLPGLAAWLLRGSAWRGATLYAQGRFTDAASAFRDAPFAGASYDQGTALAKAGRLPEAVDALNEALYRDPNDEDARYNLALVESLKSKRERAARQAAGAANAKAAEQRHSRQEQSTADDAGSTGEGAAGDRDSGRQANAPGGAAVEKAGRAPQTRTDAEGGAARGAIGDGWGPGRIGGSPKVAQSFEEMRKLPKMSFSQQAVQPSLQWLQTIPDDPGQFLKLKLAAERAGRVERGVAAPAGTDQW